MHIRTVDARVREAPEVLVKDERGACSYLDGPIPLNWWLPELPSDWPGVLCRDCDTRMRDGGYVSLLDFRFSRNPKCPRCWAERTQRALFGDLAHRGYSAMARLSRMLQDPRHLDMHGVCVYVGVTSP